MAITSNIIVDTVGGTVTTSVYTNGTPIDQVVYTASSNQVAFSGGIASASLAVQDFLALLATYITINQVIINTFGPSQFTTTPWSSITQIISDDGVSQLVSEFMPGSVPLFNYTCTYPSGNVLVTTRALPKTLSYAQFLYFLYVMANFKLQVKNDYNI
jgi:hypothetical protein